MKMPTVYIPHGGGPCFFMEWNPPDLWTPMADFLKGISATLPQRPRAILLISAHWAERAFTLSSNPRPALIYDYYGFPAHTYQLTYPAAGDPSLAQRAASLLAAAGITASSDSQRGYDHGGFIPLKLVYPDADIPVVPLSLRGDYNPAAHIAAGRALAPLRDEGVLILGSGMSFHNLRMFGDPRAAPAAKSFDDWLRVTVESNQSERETRLTGWEQAPSARIAHPPRGEEHLLPLFVAAGAAGADSGQRIFGRQTGGAMISAYRFG